MSSECYILACVAACVLSSAGVGVSAEVAKPSTTHEGKTIRLLTVGNSFSGNATRYLDELATAAGNKLVLVRADLPGCPMERHWKAIEAAEADPKALPGRPYAVTVSGSPYKRHSLKEILTSQKWDFVTIQQASIDSPDIKTYRPYARNLRDYIKKHAPQAEVLIHETWAYRCDDPGFAKDGNSQDKMYQGLRAAYQTIAKELGLRLMPVGDALHAADTDEAWRYRPTTFDKTSLKYPDLPDQTHSLNVGWEWLDDNGGHKLTMDGHHASALGCYLAGCVWFEILFNESVENNKFVPEGISDVDAKYLRGVAHRVGSRGRERP